MEDELYRWQEEALNTWYSDEGKRGIIEAATDSKQDLPLLVSGNF